MLELLEDKNKMLELELLELLEDAMLEQLETLEEEDGLLELLFEDVDELLEL